jgi:hypothetical protein
MYLVLMLSEFPQEFIMSILKPSRRGHHSSETTYQNTAIPYVKDISKKFKHIAYWFNVRTICKTKQTLCGTLMKTGNLQKPNR